MVEIWLDAGSTHMGKKEYVEELVRRSKNVGVAGVKFQLFPDTIIHREIGNVHLTQELFKYALKCGKNYGIKVTASVFDEASADFILTCDVPFIKISFSQSLNESFASKFKDKNIVVSCDHNNVGQVKSLWGSPRTYLYCIPQYPVLFQPNFDGCFPKFDGFSDHTTGVDQTMCAIRAGAKFIEKHVTLDHKDVVCPDSNFAISFKEVERLVSESSFIRW